MAEIEENDAQSRLLELEAAVLQDVEHFGACSLGEKQKIQRLQLAIQSKLSQLRALTRDLELLFEELDSDEDRQPVAVLLTRHKAEYERIQLAFKQAAVQQRRRAAQSAVEERRELLAGAADPAAKQRQLQTQAELVSASENVTDGLRRTRQVLAEQLEHTSTTLAAMDQSHAQLGRTKDEYHSQAGLLKTSKGLLGTLNWQQRAERAMLWIGLAVFMVVVAYIVQKRVGYFLPSALSPSALLGRVVSPAPPATPLGAHKLSQAPAGSAGTPPLPGNQPGLPPHFEHRQPPPQQQQQQLKHQAPHHQQQPQQPQFQEWPVEKSRAPPVLIQPPAAAPPSIRRPAVAEEFVIEPPAPAPAPAAPPPPSAPVVHLPAMPHHAVHLPSPPPGHVAQQVYPSHMPDQYQMHVVGAGAEAPRPEHYASEWGEAAVPHAVAPPAQPQGSLHPPGVAPPAPAAPASHEWVPPPGAAPPAVPHQAHHVAAGEWEGQRNIGAGQQQQQQQQGPPAQPEYHGGFDPVTEAVVGGEEHAMETGEQQQKPQQQPDGAVAVPHAGEVLERAAPVLDTVVPPAAGEAGVKGVAAGEMGQQWDQAEQQRVEGAAGAGGSEITAAAAGAQEAPSDASVGEAAEPRNEL